jgi:hypothetical protein
VLADVAEGKVSAEAAHASYGVLIDRNGEGLGDSGVPRQPEGVDDGPSNRAGGKARLI